MKGHQYSEVKIDRAGLSNLGRCERTELRQISMFLPQPKKHPDDRELAYAILVNEMRFERKTLPLNSMLRGAVEVNLVQLELIAFDPHEAAGLDIHLEGMTVVDDRRSARRVIETKRAQIDIERLANIDRRLIHPVATQPEIGRKARPMVWPGLAVVAPMHIAPGYPTSTAKPP